MESHPVVIPFQGNSMAPLIRTGHKIHLEKIGKLKLGKLIVFKDQHHELICHRIVKLGPLICKGDGSLQLEKVNADHIIGSVEYVETEYHFFKIQNLLDPLTAKLSFISRQNRFLRAIFLIYRYLVLKPIIGISKRRKN